MSTTVVTPAVNNLRPFVHPVYKRRFSFMTPRRVIEVADGIVEKLQASGFETVIVSESGASPLARICELLASKRGYHFRWLYVKFPRDPVSDIYPVLSYYLSADEKQALGESLKNLCRQIPARTAKNTLAELVTNGPDISDYHKRASQLLRTTSIAKKLRGRCIFFDEYIDSGTTLGNALYYLPFFNEHIHVRIGSYYMNLDNPKQYQRVAFSLYDTTTKEQCFADGVYPFENRIDLIGYWYTLTPGRLIKTSFASLLSWDRDEASADRFIADLYNALDDSSLNADISSNLITPALKHYLTIHHTVLYFLYLFEKRSSGESVYTELINQLYEMYAPIWSPLPDEYHMEFVKAFETTKSAMLSSPIFQTFLKPYQKIRKPLMRHIAVTLHRRNRRYVSTINNLLSTYDR